MLFGFSFFTLFTLNGTTDVMLTTAAATAASATTLHRPTAYYWKALRNPCIKPSVEIGDIVKTLHGQ
jgi:hypothetical protein